MWHLNQGCTSEDAAGQAEVGALSRTVRCRILEDLPEGLTLRLRMYLESPVDDDFMLAGSTGLSPVSDAAALAAVLA